VAVGSIWNGEDSDAAIWTSSDGTIWTQVSTDGEPFGGGGDQWIDRAASGPNGLVALGGERTEELGRRAAVWTSQDGDEWIRAPHSEELPGDADTFISDLVAGGPGFVAVGTTQPPSGAHQAIVWTSENGKQWTLLLGQDLDDDSTSSGMLYLTVGGPGLVAVGTRGQGEGEQITIWITPPDNTD
jgi:hypothetical protein